MVVQFRFHENRVSLITSALSSIVSCGYSFHMKTPQHLHKKRGRPRGGCDPIHLMLPPALTAWAKAQPEGLSGLARKLFEDEYVRRTLHEPHTEKQRPSS
jgi:hypothetical protein